MPESTTNASTTLGVGAVEGLARDGEARRLAKAGPLIKDG